MDSELTQRTVTEIVPHWLMSRHPRKRPTYRTTVNVVILGTLCVVLGVITSSLYFDPPVSQYASEKNSTDKLHSVYTKLASSMSSVPLWSSSKSDDNKSIDLYATNETIDLPISTYFASGGRPIVSKVTILTGDSNSYYERAIRTHVAHNRIHGYAMHTLRESILDDVWSKPAYILSVMLRELAKPIGERVQWLLWVDADTIILNPYVSVETFLPPGDWDDVHLLVSYDWNGLNNGVFPIRVCSWSVDLLSAILAYPYYRPDKELVFRDQSAMADLLEQHKFARHTVKTPQRWFNAYQGEVNETLAPFQVRRGDLLVHFAGVPDRDQRMDHWLQRAEMHSDEWEIEFRYTSYATEAKDFWNDMRSERKLRKAEVAKQKQKAEETLKFLTQAFDKFRASLEEDDVKRFHEQRVNLRKAVDDAEVDQDAESLGSTAQQARTDMKGLVELWEQHLRELKQEAHNSIFRAEKVILSGHGSDDSTTEIASVKSAIKKLKGALLEAPSDPKLLIEATKNLRSKYVILKSKLKQQQVDKETTEESMDESEGSDSSMTDVED